jgi:hypothetical protein
MRDDVCRAMVAANLAAENGRRSGAVESLKSRVQSLKSKGRKGDQKPLRVEAGSIPSQYRRNAVAASSNGAQDALPAARLPGVARTPGTHSLANGSSFCIRPASFCLPLLPLFYCSTPFTVP